MKSLVVSARKSTHVCFRSHKKGETVRRFQHLQDWSPSELNKIKGRKWNFIDVLWLNCESALNSIFRMSLRLFFFLLGLPFDIFWLVFHRSSLVHSHLQQRCQRYRAAPVSISCPGICIYWGIVCNAAWRVVLLVYGQCSALRFRAGSFSLAHNWSVC